MKKLAIISEFNPFHNGHKYLIDKAKKITKADIAISLMSGDFVQRGEASLIDKYSRADVALDNGKVVRTFLGCTYAACKATSSWSNPMQIFFSQTRRFFAVKMSILCRLLLF